MKIFITGSSGFIGKNLVKFYKNYTIFEFRKGMNISDEIHKFDPDLIINCAAEIYNSDVMFETNVDLVRKCLEYVKKNPLTKMIQLGSSSEYGTYDKATSETDVLKPENIYAGTKAAATVLCQSYAILYNLDIIIVRPYSPYGPGDTSHRLFPSLWRSFILDEPMTLVQGVHDFCYIDDFIEALDIIIHSNKRIPGEIINISSGIQISNQQLLTAFKTVTGRDGKVTVVDTFVTPLIWQANIEYIRQKYQWSPKETLHSGIKKFLKRANYE